MFPVCCEYCVLFFLYVVHLFRVVLHPDYYVFWVVICIVVYCLCFWASSVMCCIAVCSVLCCCSVLCYCSVALLCVCVLYVVHYDVLLSVAFVV